MYRAVTWHFLQCGCAASSGDAGADLKRRQTALATISLSFVDGRLLLDGRDISEVLRTQPVEAHVSAVAALPFVRTAMRELQRAVAVGGPMVAEGRDMGSVVFPQARWKVYLDAQPAARAARRLGDFQRQGRQVAGEQVLAEIVARDHFDSTRQDAPLVRCADAFYVDSTNLTTDQVVERLLAHVRSRPNNPPARHA